MIDMDGIVGKEGLFTLEDGRSGYTHIINEHGKYLLRVEDGWYWEYDKTGIRKVCGAIVEANGESRAVNPPGGNIVSFVECRYARGMPVFRP